MSQHESPPERPRRGRRQTTVELLLASAFAFSILSYSCLDQIATHRYGYSSSSSSSSSPEDVELDAPWPLSSEEASDTVDRLQRHNSNGGGGGGISRNDDHHRHHPADEAEFIIRKSYAETYGRMYRCEDGVIEKECIELVAERLHDDNDDDEHRPNNNDNGTNDVTVADVDDNAPDDDDEQQRSHDGRDDRYFRVPSSHPYPWWFQTLLRDAPTNGAYGFWHHFKTNSTHPPLTFCAIGKNGSTEWRRIFRALNYEEFCGERGEDEEEEKENEKKKKACDGKFNTGQVLSDDPSITPMTVFVRDPLERLLSGYLDKCVKPNIRASQGHCEPNAIFGVDYLKRKAAQTKTKKGEPSREMKRRGKVVEKEEEELFEDLSKGLRDTLSDKELFAAYVDLLPLKWNVHFVPQALFCDLYRNIGDYDFVGVMGKSFMSELDRMARRYGGPLPNALDDAFGYKSKLSPIDVNAGTSPGKDNVGAENGHGTRAPAKVAMYYSARTVRRALEYLSIDYVTLGMEVPVWAVEMLREDAVVS